MDKEIELASVKVIRPDTVDVVGLAADVLNDALDYAYKNYKPSPGEELPDREDFGVGESKNIGGEVLIGFFIKGLVSGAGAAVATKTVQKLWELAERYIQNMRGRDVELQPGAAGQIREHLGQDRKGPDER